jgi:exopolysaccharide biosynthesis protein
MRARFKTIQNRTVLMKVTLFLSLCLCVLCGHSSAQDWKTVHDGVEYAEVTREISGLKVSMNLLRLDLTQVRLDVHHAIDAAIGTEKTSSIAARHGAVAAINAGFFRLDSSIWAGDAAGVLRIDGRLLSESNNSRVAIGITNDLDNTRVQFGHVTTSIEI